MALREDQDSGGEAEALGDAGQVGEHHERVVERIVLGVGACQLRRSIGVNGAEDVVVGQEVVKAQVLDRSADPSDRGRISSKLNLRVDDADLHGVQPATARTVAWDWGLPGGVQPRCLEVQEIGLPD